MSKQWQAAARVFEFLMESQHWPAADLRDYQLQQLEQLLRHARAQVPYYNKSLAPVFRGDGSINFGRWHELPILKREDLAQNPDAFNAASVPQNHGKVSEFRTSGSTGHPVVARHTWLAGQCWKAMTWRSHRWWGADWNENIILWQHIEPGKEKYAPDQPLGPWGNPDYEASAKGTHFVNNTAWSLEQRITLIDQLGASYLTSQANFPFSAALEARKLGLRAHLKSIHSHGMKPEPEFKQAVIGTIAEDWRAMYSAKEGGRMGYSCPDGDHYHINAETVLVEVVDDHGFPCKVGEEGRIIVTPFLGTAQPLIRYEQGDRGILGPPCSCGITLPVLTDVSGRIYHTFTHRSGRILTPTIPDSLRAELGADFWQFAQIDADTIEVRYRPSTSRDSARESQFAKAMLSHLGVDFRVIFAQIHTLPQTASGKFLKYSYEVERRT